MWNLKSFAKINLFLEITGKLGNLHSLHSLFLKINLCDDIEILPAEKLKIEYTNTTVSGDIIQKTINILQKYFPCVNVDFYIKITKNIPIGAGIGGASGNAAVILKFLLECNNVEISNTQLMEIGKEIGSDVPFFLYNSAMILNGTSIELTKPNFKIPKLWCVISCPNIQLLTKDVFANITPPYTKFKAVTSFEEATLRQNDMQVQANLLTNGKINKNLCFLFSNKAIITRMSGSGASCFSLFRNENDAKECLQNMKNNINFTVFCVEVLQDR